MPEQPAAADSTTSPGEANRPVLLSLQVGLPQTFGGDTTGTPAGENGEAADPWESGIAKTAVTGEVRFEPLNIAGDGQADLSVHGGVDKAVHAYAACHYPLWQSELNLPELGPGGFGENLTVGGLDETAVCLGDVWQLGSVLLEVSQPRRPCWKLARRWNVRLLPKLVVQTGRTGWYLRVKQPGTAAAGLPLTLVERPHPAWTITRANQVMHGRGEDQQPLRELAAVPQLAASWKKSLQQKIESD